MRVRHNRFTASDLGWTSWQGTCGCAKPYSARSTFQANRKKCRSHIWDKTQIADGPETKLRGRGCARQQNNRNFNIIWQWKKSLRRLLYDRFQQPVVSDPHSASFSRVAGVGCCGLVVCLVVVLSVVGRRVRFVQQDAVTWDGRHVWELFPFFLFKNAHRVKRFCAVCTRERGKHVCHWLSIGMTLGRWRTFIYQLD